MSSPSEEPRSDRKSSTATTDLQIVMAEQSTHDVVKEAQSMGGPSPIDDTASVTNHSAGNGEAPSGPKTTDSNLSNDAIAPGATTSEIPTTTARVSETADGGVTNASIATPDNQLRSNTPSNDAKEQLANGDTGEISATESQNAGGEGSAGSDTDISRPGSVDPAKQPGGHLRTNSVKKPASFKSVSVTKNFLAKSAVSTPIARPGDKASTTSSTATSALQTARPRLVAKSGGTNTPRSLGKLNGAGSGPDASKVWNKNQPVPPAPPKQFTDEELKQQYGIHLATRLQADEVGKEAKWADIDDDEDDWAPETVQWMDGTKSTVAAENQPPPTEEPKVVPKNEVPVATAKPSPTPTSTQRSGLTGGTKTILKPGASAQAIAAKPKGQPEKPTLVAKPSTAAPVKSPWAQLPPVDKVSPVQINPPAPQPPSRYPRDPYGYDDMPPTHAPAKEIAPDDFNRAWRDDRGNRELFNSHSGRYEPVGEMRRGSMRDNGYRQQPSVLQRPSQDGPAEPSAAFQTSRTSADGPGWGRRRNSSNVSGGSGRRMSFDRRGPDLAPLPTNMSRRESQPANGIDAVPRHALPTNPGPMDQQPSSQSAAFAQNVSPNVGHVQPASPFGSVASQEAGAPGGPSQMQNLVEVQERLLHSNIDAIKLRKQKEKEQEAREEAERKERLRKRLEAMGFKDEPKDKAKDETSSRAPQKSPQKEKAVPAPVLSPPKPPVPTSQGEVAQYGMMKVHQPQPVKKPALAEATAKAPVKEQTRAQTHVEAPAKTLSSLTPSLSPAHKLARDSDISKPAAEQVQTQQAQQATKPIGADLKAGQLPQGPWSTTAPLPQQRSAGWGSSVWGPPQARDRALGNGTFGQQVPAQPEPNTTAIGLNAALPAQPQQLAPVRPYPPTQGQAAMAPPPPPPSGRPAPPILPGWGSFQVDIRQSDRDLRAKNDRDLERIGREFRPEMRESYKDHDGSGKENTVHTTVAKREAAGAQAALTAETKPAGNEPAKPHDGAAATSQAPHAAPQAAPQGTRSSRFFPKDKQQAAEKHESPPPPETESHPAFSGNTSHPVVRMPRPSPRVRLPPAIITGEVIDPDVPVVMPVRTRLGIGARPIALTQAWQDRFKSLLAPAPSPIAKPSPTAQTKAASLAVASSSKAPLDVRETTASATVSLPVSATRKPEDGSSGVTTCSGAEDLLEDREFGSLPTVRLPKTPHLAADEPVVGFPAAPRPFTRGPKFFPTSKASFNNDKPDIHDNTIDVTVRVGSMQDAVIKSMPVRRKGSRVYGQQKPRRSLPNGATSSPANGSSPRSRKPSNFQGPGTNPNNPTRGPSGNGWPPKRAAPPAPVH